jgi:hypothetical protein
MADVEATIAEVTRPSVRAWPAKVERNAKRHPGVA